MTEPSVPSGVVVDPDGGPHSHPLPFWVRTAILGYGLVIALAVLSALAYAVLQTRGAQDRSAAQTAAAKGAVLAELDRRSAKRDQQAAAADADAAETRRLVDDLRRELAALRALAEGAGLDTSSVPRTRPRGTATPSPAAQPSPQPRLTSRPGGAGPSPGPRPGGTPPPTPRPTAAPSPSPSPLLCQVPLVGAGLCPRGRA